MLNIKQHKWIWRKFVANMLKFRKCNQVKYLFRTLVKPFDRTNQMIASFCIHIFIYQREMEIDFLSLSMYTIRIDSWSLVVDSGKRGK